MTDPALVANDPNYILVHNAGFVGLVGTYGSDELIERSARVSYGQGTRSTSDRRALIRYLMKHQHTSPFEMAEVQFHIRLPIFVMRQLIRHRTANVNEYSMRYSEATDDMFHPAFWRGQSTTNKQGSSGPLDTEIQIKCDSAMNGALHEASTQYHQILEFGATREQARIVIPVANYTECYWKMDLHNFMHMLKLRLDPHAQEEIRDFAEAMYELVRPKFPITFEAFEDYKRNAVTFSAMEMRALKDKLTGNFVDNPEHYGMSKREWEEFHSSLRT